MVRGRVSIIVNICLALLVVLSLGSTIALECHSSVSSQKLAVTDGAPIDSLLAQTSSRPSSSPIGDVCVGIFFLILLVGKSLFNRIVRSSKLLLLPEIFAKRVNQLCDAQFVFTMTLPQLGISRT